ncbi:MAG: hypothetical protein AABW46_01880 [Nanoarchaeota archaeon]
MVNRYGEYYRRSIPSGGRSSFNRVKSTPLKNVIQPQDIKRQTSKSFLRKAVERIIAYSTLGTIFVGANFRYDLLNRLMDNYEYNYGSVNPSSSSSLGNFDRQIFFDTKDLVCNEFFNDIYPIVKEAKLDQVANEIGKIKGGENRGIYPIVSHSFTIGTELWFRNFVENRYMTALPLYINETGDSSILRDKERLRRWLAFDFELLLKRAVVNEKIIDDEKTIVNSGLIMGGIDDLVTSLSRYVGDTDFSSYGLEYSITHGIRGPDRWSPIRYNREYVELMDKVNG